MVRWQLFWCVAQHTKSPLFLSIYSRSRSIYNRQQRRVEILFWKTFRQKTLSFISKHKKKPGEMIGFSSLTTPRDMICIRSVNIVDGTAAASVIYINCVWCDGGSSWRRVLIGYLPAEQRKIKKNKINLPRRRRRNCTKETHQVSAKRKEKNERCQIFFSQSCWSRKKVSFWKKKVFLFYTWQPTGLIFENKKIDYPVLFFFFCSNKN